MSPESAPPTGMAHASLALPRTLIFRARPRQNRLRIGRTRLPTEAGGNEAKQGPGQEAGMVERLLSEGMTGTDHPRQLVAKQHLGAEAGRNPVERAQRDIDLMLIERLRKFGAGVDDLQGYARSRLRARAISRAVRLEK